MAIDLFISYDYDNDKHYKNLLLAWDANEMFDFEFYDRSIDVSVNSEDATYIKKVIKGRINDCTHFLCIVGKHTHESDWVEWEIETAVALGKKIVVVKIDNSYDSPPAIFGAGASWARSFAFDSIMNAVDAV